MITFRSLPFGTNHRRPPNNSAKSSRQYTALHPRTLRPHGVLNIHHPAATLATRRTPAPVTLKSERFSDSSIHLRRRSGSKIQETHTITSNVCTHLGRGLSYRSRSISATQRRDFFYEHCIFTSTLFACAQSSAAPLIPFCMFWVYEGNF